MLAAKQVLLNGLSSSGNPKATVSRKPPICAATNDWKRRHLALLARLSEGPLTTHPSHPNSAVESTAVDPTRGRRQDRTAAPPVRDNQTPDLLVSCRHSSGIPALRTPV
jgi:hypothetical protein